MKKLCYPHFIHRFSTELSTGGDNCREACTFTTFSYTFQLFYTPLTTFFYTFSTMTYTFSIFCTKKPSVTFAATIFSSSKTAGSALEPAWVVISFPASCPSSCRSWMFHPPAGRWWRRGCRSSGGWGLSRPSGRWLCFRLSGCWPWWHPPLLIEKQMTFQCFLDRGSSSSAHLKKIRRANTLSD